MFNLFDFDSIQYLLVMGRRQRETVKRRHGGITEVDFAKKSTRRGVQYVATPSSPPPETPPPSPKKARHNDTIGPGDSNDLMEMDFLDGQGDENHLNEVNTYRKSGNVS